MSTLSSGEMCAVLGVGETKLHRLSKVYGYQHRGSGQHTRYPRADIPAFKAILAAQTFSRGGDVTGTRQGLPPEMLADLGRQYADNRQAEILEVVDGLVIRLTIA